MVVAWAVEEASVVLRGLIAEDVAQPQVPASASDSALPLIPSLRSSQRDCSLGVFLPIGAKLASTPPLFQAPLLWGSLTALPAPCCRDPFRSPVAFLKVQRMLLC